MKLKELSTHKNPSPNTTSNRPFCLFPFVRSAIRFGIGIRNIPKSVTMFIVDDKYQTGSTGRHRPFMDWTIDASGRQASARIATWTADQMRMKIRAHLHINKVRSPTKRRR